MSYEKLVEEDAFLVVMSIQFLQQTKENENEMENIRDPYNELQKNP